MSDRDTEIRPCCSLKRLKSLKNSFERQRENSFLNVNSYMENIQSQLPLVQNQAKSNPVQSPSPKSQHFQTEKHENQFEKVELKVDERDQIIQTLKKNNRMITYQVQLIWQKLKQEPEKVKSQRKLMQSSSNYETLQKQLKNAYNLIKIIEKEIKQSKKKEKASKQMISKMKSLKKDLDERTTITVNLKNELLVKIRQTKQLQKKIEFKTDHQNKIELQTLTKEINHLYQVVTESEKKEEDKLRTIKKQYEQVKKMERELVQKGISQIELEQMKKRCIIEISPQKHFDNSKHKQNFIKEPKQKSQPRTLKQFNQMINEIKLLSKKQSSFQQQYTQIDNERKAFSVKNVQIQNQLKHLQNEIDNLEQLSEKLRTKRILKHRKKERLKSLELKKIEQEKQLQLRIKRQQFKQSYEKRRKRYKSLPTSEIRHEKQTQIKQTDQIKECELKYQSKEQLTTENTIFQNKRHTYGIGGESSNKFNDRYILGKEHYGKKITQITVYFDPISQYISGLSVGYENGIKGGDYIWRTSRHQNYYKVTNYECGQGYVRDIYCEFKLVGNKSRLVGIQIELNEGLQRKFGIIEHFEPKLSENEYVSCIFGAMSVFEEEGRMISAIQEVGMQIYQ